MHGTVNDGHGASDTAPAGRPTILVVDDDATVRLSLEVLLEDLGYAVIAADDGMRGLAAFRKHRPALVLTDIIMPRMDGIELVREMRRERSDVKIIAMSGGGRVGNTDFVALAQKLGADAGIQKPFDGDALNEILITLLRSEYAAPGSVAVA